MMLVQLPTIASTTRVLFLMFAIGLNGGSAKAFGRTGNQIVAEIAQRELSSGAAEIIASLLSLENKHSLSDIADWTIDWVQQHPEHKEWFIDRYPLQNKSFFMLNEVCPKDICLSQMVNYYFYILSDRRKSPEVRLEALKFFVGLTAASWQPMNCIDNHDDNGHAIELSFSGDSDKTTLYEWWNSRAIDLNFETSNHDEHYRNKISTAADTILGHSPSKSTPVQPPLHQSGADKPRISPGDFAQTTAIAVVMTAHECSSVGGPDLPLYLSSYIIGRDFAYQGIAFPGQPSPTGAIILDDGYRKTSWFIIVRQLRNAGLDLAYMLNRLADERYH